MWSCLLLFVGIFSHHILVGTHDVPVKNRPQPDKDHTDEEEPEIEADDEHVDWEPVLEFPDARPDYKETARNGSENLQEEGHWQLHKIVNAVIHKEIQTAEMIDDFQKLAINGSEGGTFIKPYVPMKTYMEKKREEQRKMKKKEKEEIKDQKADIDKLKKQGVVLT
eukprot:TCONS_00017201-protein